MSEKHKCTSPSAIQVKNQWGAISTEDKINLISQLEKGKQIVDKWCNVRPAYSSVHTVRDNVDTVTESAESGDRVFV